MAERKKSLINMLLEMKPSDWKMMLLFFPTFHGLWLYGIGKILLQKQNRSSKLFSFFSISATIIVTAAVITPYIYACFGGELLEYNRKYFWILILSSPFYLVTICMLTALSVRYDRQEEENRHFGFAANLDYLRRFFSFVYWPFFVWDFQKRVNIMAATKVQFS